MVVKHKKNASAALESYLNAWKGKDYIAMTKHCTETWLEDKAVIGISILEHWYEKDLQGFRIISAKQTGNAAMDFVVAVQFPSEDEKVERVRVICEAAPYRPTIMGRWGVNPVSGLRLLN